MNIMRITDEAGWESSKAPRLMLRNLKDPGRRGLISRELRLFACACVRHIGELLEFEQSWQAVDVGERYADGDANHSELKAAYDAAQCAERSINQRIKAINSDNQNSGGAIIEGWRLLLIDDWHPEGRRKHAAEAASFCARTFVIGNNRNPNVKYCGDWNLALAAATRAHLASASRDTLEAENAMFVANGGEYPLYEDGWQAELLRCIFRNPLRPIATAQLDVEPCIGEIAESIYRLRAFDRLPVLGKHLEAVGSADADLLSHCVNAHVHTRGCWAVDMARGVKRCR